MREHRGTGARTLRETMLVSRAAVCLGVCALLFAALPAAAQQPGTPQAIDGIVAVVGQRIILLSEVDEEINQRRGQGLVLPTDSAGLLALRRQVLQDVIDDEVLFVRARQDTSITVTDAEVQSAVEEQVRQVRSQFRTDQEYRAALLGAGLGSPEEYRRWLTEKQRRSSYQQRFIQKMQQEGKLRSGTVSEAELRRAYQAAMAQQQRRRPPTISFQQVVVAPQPAPQARARARLLAESVQVELDRGADFAEAARRFTSDVSTRESGGDLGFFRRGMMVRAFEDVAFQLRPGVVSPVVETQYGFHIIKVERIQTAEVKARHILFSPEITDADLAVARAQADSMAVLIRGGANTDSLARLWGDTAEPRQVGPADRTQMNPAYAQAFTDIEIGSVVGPFEMNPESPQRIRYVVVQVTDVQPERDFTFDEVRDQMRTNMLRERGIRNLLEDLRRRTYVDVRL